MSTPKNTGRLEPRATMHIAEICIAGALLVGILLIGPIGYDAVGWSQKTAALVSSGGALAGLLMWFIIRFVLVEKGIIRPIDHAVAEENTKRPAARR